MTRKLVPFKRADGLHELAVIGNLGLEYAYSSSEKVTHFVEDPDVNEVRPDQYYIQFDGNFTLPQYKSKGVHLIRNIELGDEMAEYEVFNVHNDGEDESDWKTLECPASDFPSLFDRGKLIPMKEPSEQMSERAEKLETYLTCDHDGGNSRNSRCWKCGLDMGHWDNPESLFSDDIVQEVRAHED